MFTNTGSKYFEIFSRGQYTCSYSELLIVIIKFQHEIDTENIYNQAGKCQRSLHHDEMIFTENIKTDSHNEENIFTGK